MNFKEYPDREMLSIAVANRIAGDLKNHLLRHDQAALAVAGGTTPGPIFDDLCAAELDWENVCVMATDERWVPADSERSNARLIRNRLLTNRAAVAQFLPFYVEGEEPDNAVVSLSEQVKSQCNLAVVLLGMGEDMHTASLFPGVAGLAEALSADAGALAVMRPDSQPEARITLTAPILDSAMAKHLVIFGDAKREALDRAVSLPPEEAPIQAVLSECQVHWAP
ncbi:6-phosphogluconolactonase [Epibacterium sp. MM17-32]|uniref:6-phosphogluconolactonase n=1 Tax=Epibacterium sp. MM17-32 TaxID=2917734 RepID=UPI001EF6744F|nr:6-phosphogluconolactonase [Epibacterium sp. MM17-32]MCG7626456.1 6-phosphogluconolactonase [Epibacterium sp. MM17-32]